MRLVPNEQPPTDVFRLREWLTRLVININAALQNKIPEYEVVQVTANSVALGGQILICRNTANIDITLNPNAQIGDFVYIKRRGSNVTVLGNVEGTMSTSLTSSTHSLHLCFDGTDWSTI
jgi:hypothetical protein